ncbi:putative E3 ubiquitin-protein ligase UBR7 [Antedon mediterranea]|uniref:putative E3 ubiquitin-protein ligase UBR7 n=1 Tax=Antedon mediterranea TaxID=105859 RepID=UPI003AF910DD
MAGCSTSEGGGHNITDKNESDGEIVSMIDVLNADNDLEEEANAVLGDSDDKCCTFPQGYLGRQALYACETCCPDGLSEAAICLACSYECHEGHDLYELYTKRHIRCDCGNTKFQNLTCKIFPNKSEINDENKYNQNYKGLYCTCKRPYPDPDDEVADEMIQCVVCEDWYHGRHLGIGPPEYMDYQEMICTTCMDKHSFLWAYTVDSIETKCIENQEDTKPVEIENKNTVEEEKTDNVQGEEAPPAKRSRQTDYDTVSSAQEEKTENTSSAANEAANKTTDEATQEDTKDGLKPANENKLEHSNEESELGCILDELMKRSLKPAQHATFWPSGWRAKLCACLKCKELYKLNHLEFLPNLSDTVLAYEERGKAKQTPGVTQYDRGIQALSHMHRTQQIEVISEYNDLQSELKDYLRKFSDEGKVVQEEDIKIFFEGLKTRKRQRSDVAVQNFCR